MDKHVAIVTTTINHPEEVFTNLARGGHLVVAGDMKTPVETEYLVKELGGTYLRPVDQHRWTCSESIGWNCIQRRNIAVLEAARMGAEVMILVDDDNYPESDKIRDGALDWVDDHMALLDAPVQSVGHSTNGWFNPGRMLEPEVIARGIPYDVDPDQGYVTHQRSDTNLHVGVNAGLWFGDPDIDALQRIVRKPIVTGKKFIVNVHVKPGIWSPINSQNTSWRASTVPLAAVLPHVGRWDDILGGYMAEWSMWAAGYVASYGSPIVRQTRNDHDLFVDLEKETPWLRRTTLWTEMLEKLPATGEPLVDMKTLARKLEGHQHYSRVSRFLNDWVYDWEHLRR